MINDARIHMGRRPVGFINPTARLFDISRVETLLMTALPPLRFTVTNSSPRLTISRQEITLDVARQSPSKSRIFVNDGVSM
jgi:hypothetical protein